MSESFEGDKDEDLEFTNVLRELDKETSHIVARLEVRRFRKPVTIIQGLPGNRVSLLKVGSALKQRLATGGAAKDGIVILQGDHRNRVKIELDWLGFNVTNIEVH